MTAQPATLYRDLRRIRRVEEEIARIYPSDKIKSPVHLSIGQEAVAVGVCQALHPDDVVSVTYRCHAAYLAKGGDLPAMMAELFGKATGCAGGKGGSMHLVDMDAKVLGASAVVGTNIPIALGWALSFKMAGSGRIVACFLGDGATEEGVFYESLNFAALHRLPVLFVCENNGYAIHTPLEKRWATPELCSRVAAFGVPTRQIGDGEVFAIGQAATEAVAEIRAGAGPAFLECQIYRWREHVGPGEDFDAGYRGREEAKAWMENDSVERVGSLLPPAERARIDDEIEAEIAAAIDFAERSPVPEEEDLYRNVFSG
jgi:pyruvate dehydrogenase E1 component alpha subunit